MRHYAVLFASLSLLVSCTEGRLECRKDCAGTPCGLATEDACGVCDDTSSNDNVTCADCAGTPYGRASVDHCWTCDTDPFNDCEQDCTGVWGGSAYRDQCGVCDTDPSNDNVVCLDCAGIPHGEAVLDLCGVCDDIPTNDCVQDCEGEWGGLATRDSCGVCDEDSSNDNVTCADCGGTPHGMASLDMCGMCDTYTTNDCIQDCAGAWGGLATVDMCGVCDSDPTNDCIEERVNDPESGGVTCAPGELREIDCHHANCPAGVLSATCVGVGWLTAETSYLVLERDGYTRCSANEGSHVTAWSSWQSCLFSRGDWMPGVICGDVDCSTYPCVWTESALAQDIMAVGKWRGQCHYLCASNECTVSASSQNAVIYYKCGDGTVYGDFEECDDGNNEDGDGCSKWCIDEAE